MILLERNFKFFSDVWGSYSYFSVFLPDRAEPHQGTHFECPAHGFDGPVVEGKVEEEQLVAVEQHQGAGGDGNADQAEKVDQDTGDEAQERPTAVQGFEHLAGHWNPGEKTKLKPAAGGIWIRS